MSKATEEATAERPWLFGSGAPDRDPRTNGSRGGSAPKHSKVVATARRNVLRSKSGQANAYLLKLELEREQERERERARLDAEIVGLYEEREEVRAQVDELKDERDRARTARAALVRRLELLHTSVIAEQHGLVGRLRALHEHGGLEPALEALGLFEKVDD